MTTQQQVSCRGKIIIGTFIDAPQPRQLRVRKNTVCVVNTSGFIETIGPFDQSETIFHGREEYDIVELGETQLMVPGLIDLHIHAPQYKQLGTKTDVELMKWLLDYTYPAEGAFSDITHARKIYSALVKRLLRNGTTSAVLYGSNHLEATKELANICSDAGLRAFVGKTCADMLTPDYYVEETQTSILQTELFIQYVREKWGNDKNTMVYPVVTPRFIPTCSKELLTGLGSLAEKYDCYTQSHAAESVDEEALVEQQWNGERDIAVYKSTGLLRKKTIMAHCCRLQDSEAQEIASCGSSIASCPYSNILFARAVVPIAEYHQKIPNLNIGLGTDMAGGWSSSLWENMRIAVLQDRVENFAAFDRTVVKSEDKIPDANWTVDFIWAFHLATMGGAKCLELEHLIGSFEEGKSFDALVIDANVASQRFDYYGDEDAQELFEKFVTTGDDRNIVKVFVKGHQVI